MEIGVLNGETRRTMVDVAIKKVPHVEVEYCRFDFFRMYSHHQAKQKLEKTGCTFKLIKGTPLKLFLKLLKPWPKMGLIFIDGGKSYFEAKSDCDHSKTLMHDEIAVFHNHNFLGVMRMVDNIPRDKYRVNIIYLSDDSDTAFIKRISDSS